MKKTVLIILFPVVLLVMLLQLDALSLSGKNDIPIIQEKMSAHSSAESIAVKNSETVHSYGSDAVAPVVYDGSIRENIVKYAFTLLGTPYLFAGNTKEGFDCSGFTTHVFDQNGVTIKRSSGLQATEGVAIHRSEAAPGDLVIFTGTDRTVREPGHVGIVISEPGDTIEFIHSSSSRSDGGVKVSQVEGSGYEARFLEVRRVL